jgi:hypothetical protein
MPRRPLFLRMFPDARSASAPAAIFPARKGDELRHASPSSAAATSSALGPCRATTVAASASISRGMRRGRMLACHSTHRSAPQIGLAAVAMTIHINACLTVSMRQQAIAWSPDYLKNRYFPCRSGWLRPMARFGDGLCIRGTSVIESVYDFSLSSDRLALTGSFRRLRCRKSKLLGSSSRSPWSVCWYGAVTSSPDQ